MAESFFHTSPSSHIDMTRFILLPRIPSTFVLPYDQGWHREKNRDSQRRGKCQPFRGKNRYRPHGKIHRRLIVIFTGMRVGKDTSDRLSDARPDPQLLAEKRRV